MSASTAVIPLLRRVGRPTIGEGKSIRKDTYYDPARVARLKEMAMESHQSEAEVSRESVDLNYACRRGLLLLLEPLLKGDDPRILDTLQAALLIAPLLEEERDILQKLPAHQLRPLVEDLVTKAKALVSATETKESHTPKSAPLSNKETNSAPEQRAAQTLWEQIIPSLKAIVGEENFRVRLSEVRGVSDQNDILTLSAPDSFQQEYLTENFTQVIEEVLSEQQTPRKLRFEKRSKLSLQNHTQEQTPTTPRIPVNKEEKSQTTPKTKQEEYTELSVSCYREAKHCQNEYHKTDLLQLAKYYLKHALKLEHTAEVQKTLETAMKYNNVVILRHHQQNGNQEGSPRENIPKSAFTPLPKGDASTRLRNLQKKARDENKRKPT